MASVRDCSVFVVNQKQGHCEVYAHREEWITVIITEPLTCSSAAPVAVSNKTGLQH